MTPRVLKGARRRVRVIVGLGNPGSRYEGTRHNVGRMLVQRLAERWKIRIGRKLCSSGVGEGLWNGQPVRLVLPETAMNASGEAVGCFLRRWRLKPADLLVALDDVSLPRGAIRIRGQGSAGGHRGLASVLEAVGSEAICRLRIGIGPGRSFDSVRPEQGRRTNVAQGRGTDLTPYVLGRFTQAERAGVEKGLAQATEACEVWMSHGVAAAMNRFNRRIVEKK